MHRGNPVLETVRARLAMVGLSLPRIPDELARHIKELDTDVFGTRVDGPPLDDLQGREREVLDGTVDDYVTFGYRSGNDDSGTFFLHLVSGPLALFARVPVNGARRDSSLVAKRMRATFCLGKELFRLARVAERKELLDGKTRLLVYHDGTSDGRVGLINCPVDRPETVLWRRTSFAMHSALDYLHTMTAAHRRAPLKGNAGGPMR